MLGAEVSQAVEKSREPVTETKVDILHYVWKTWPWNLRLFQFKGPHWSRGL